MNAGDFVTFVDKEKWWVGTVTKLFEDIACYDVRIFKPNGPAKAFYLPSPPVVLQVHISNVLTVVPKLEPRSRSSRNYVLDPDFSQITSQAFLEWTIAQNSDSDPDYD